MIYLSIKVIQEVFVCDEGVGCGGDELRDDRRA